mgnify:CR=1 FL=1
MWKKKLCKYGADCRSQDWCGYIHPGETLEDGEIKEPVSKRVKREDEVRAANFLASLTPVAPPTILIDGKNVSRHINRDRPSVPPLVRAIRYYRAKGYKVLVFLPEWAYNGGKGGKRALEDAQALKPWVDDETVSLTPAYTNDDLFLFKYVQEIEKSALVLSNDNFDDHVRAGLVTRDWLNVHTIKYTFVGGTFLPVK